ncbi:MAG: acetyltransferase [Rickettsiales bacterium]|nr:acetyltransferase [Rickettsiales bacterium]
MAKLLIFGIGKIGQVAHYHFTHDSEYEVAGFVTDRNFVPEGGLYEGLPVVAFEEVENHFSPTTYTMFVAIGYQQMNQLRADRLREAKAKGYKTTRYISSQNNHMHADQVGENSFVMSGNPIQPHAAIGANCFVWTNAIIGHHSHVADHCWITSGVVIGGNSRIGENCFLGLGSTIGHEVNVGARCLVGAGALITKDVADDGVYIAEETPRFRLTSQQFLRMTKMK